MIIRVPVSAELIEQAFITGWTSRGVLTVTEGIPDGAKLIGVEHDSLNRMVTFLFVQRGVVSEPLQSVEQSIVVQCDLAVVNHKAL